MERARASMPGIAVASGGVRAGVWRLADPKISLASIASILLGTAAAAAAGPVDPLWLVVTIVGVFALEVAKNASGEIYDWDSGTDLAVEDADRSPFSGGKRVIVDGLLSRGQTWTVAGVGYGLTIAAGLAIAAFREPGVLWLGLAGVSIAFFYHAPPLAFAYRGLGEAAVALCYGPGVAIGTYWVQRGEVGRDVVLASIPLGLLVAAFLWINQFPDYRADLGAGKRNLVVRMGRPAAAIAFAVLVWTALSVVAALPLLGAPRWTWLGLVAAVPAWAAVDALIEHPEEISWIVPAQAKTLKAFLLLSLGCGLGFLL